jgi:hypothetical protein
MTLDGDRTYEIRINDLAGNLNSVSADIHECMFWSPDLFAMEYNLKAADNVADDGSIIVSEGYRESQDIQLIGRHNSIIQAVGIDDGIPYYPEAFPYAHITNIYKLFEALGRNRNNNMYLDIELRRSQVLGSTASRRLWVKPKRTKYIPVENSRYTDGEIRIDFFVADPYFYKSSITSGSANSSSSSAQSVILNTYFPTQRHVIYIYNTNGSAISGVTGSAWASGESWVIAESLNASGSYFEIDHFNGTVKKYVGASATNIIDKFTGSFFDIAKTVDIVNVKSTGAGTFRLETHVWERAQYDTT